MKIDFTKEEMASFLRKKGYEVVFEKKECEFRTEYNNIFDIRTIDTCSIYRIGQPHMSHLFDPERPFQWLEMVFEEEFKNKILYH